MRLLIYEPTYRRVAERIDSLPGLELLIMDPEGAITLAGRPVDPETANPEAAWANAEVFFGPAQRTFARTILKSPDLKWVQSGAAGFDNKLFPMIVEKGARLTTSHGQAVGMADYVLWGVLDHWQKGPVRRADQASHTWKRIQYREIEGSRWLVIGFGSIGEGVGRRARAFGAHVTGVRRNTAPNPSADGMVAPSEVAALLPESDVVVLACPLTAETRHIANAAFFGAMKAGSMLVNVGRGGLVDEPALLAALDLGLPDHALLDVFETEPLPAESPFWDHPRVTATAHTSGVSLGNPARNDALFVENLSRYLRGEPLLHEEKPETVLAG